MKKKMGKAEMAADAGDTQAAEQPRYKMVKT